MKNSIYLQVLASKKRIFLYATAPIVLLAIALHIFWPASYYASSTLLLLGESNRNLSLGDMMRSSMVLSLAGGSTGSPTQQKIANVLMSRSLAERVVVMTNLHQDEFGAGSELTEARRVSLAEWLQGKKVKIDTRKPGLIQLSVRYSDPNRVKQLVDAYILSLREYLNSTTLTMGQKTQRFLETESMTAADGLLQARQKFREFQSTHRMISAQTSMQNFSSSYASILGSLVSVETNDRYLSQYLTQDNPYLKAERQRGEALKGKLRELEKSAFLQGGRSGGKGTPETELILEYMALEREVTLKQMIYEALQKELQMSRIDANREDLSFEVLDSPYVPTSPYFPNWKITTAATIVLLMMIHFLIFWYSYGKVVAGASRVAASTGGPSRQSVNIRPS